MKGDTSYLFTYGTLRDSTVNHKAHFLKESAIYIGPAFIFARLYKVTWYPAVILDAKEESKVFGEIFELPFASREMILHELDGYEGIYSTNEASDEYERLLTKAYTDDGLEKLCWVYNYKQPLEAEMRIQSGDYLKYLKEQR